MGKLKTAKDAYKENGARGIAKIVSEKITNLIAGRFKHEIKMLVANEDVMACEWDVNPRTFKTEPKEGPYTFNWVIHPPGKSSGGHQNIFRFIKFLEDAGHKCRIYLYSNVGHVPLEIVKKNVSTSYSKINASIEWLDGDMEQADAIFATGWETAYPVYNQKSDAKRFYFVQDFEPYFYTIGSEHALAENTYKFGFTGITAGRWLSSKLRSEFDMDCDYYDFGVDSKSYAYENEAKRNKVFFYARPVTARRGFELGILALSKFHELNPDVEIIMAGWDVSNYEIDFPYTDMAVCDIEDLPNIYNQCAAALILSFSNLSLLPLELLSCGVIPVINKGPNNEMVADNLYIKYCEPTPASLANALNESIMRNDQVEISKKAAQSVAQHTWEDSGARFIEIIERELHV